MDKKGEINFLSKILSNELLQILVMLILKILEISKELLMLNPRFRKYKTWGAIILNQDDKFFEFLKTKALKKNLKIYSFSLKNKKSYSYKIKSIKVNNKFKIYFKIGSTFEYYYSNNNSKNHTQNLLATLTTLSLFYDLKKISKNIFLDFEFPQGRGDFSKIKIGNKIINFIDESYNSNPLSLKTALSNFANIDSKQNSKHVLLGDMLELGKSSLKHHKSFIKKLNKLKIISSCLRKRYKRNLPKIKYK